MESNIKNITHGIDDILKTKDYIIDVKEALSFVLVKFNLQFESIKPYLEEYIDQTKRILDKCKHTIIITDEIYDKHVTCIVCDAKWECKMCYDVIAENNYLWSSHRCSFKGECNHAKPITRTCADCGKMYSYYYVNV